MKKLSIVYFGTPYFSARFLEKLITDSTVNQLTGVKLVVTQPDKPVGKKQTLTKSPVKIVAEKHLIPVYDSIIHHLSSIIKKIDLALVFAYGQIIPKELLTLPKYGFLNIHWSLLPKFRGAAPLPYALMLGEKETGVSIFIMDEKLDHGPVLMQEKVSLLESDQRPKLDEKFTEISFQMFRRLILTNFNTSTSLRVNQFQLTAQADQLVTYAPNLSRDDGFIPLSTLIKSLKNEPLQLNEVPKIIQDYINKYNLIGNWKLKIENSAKILYDYFRGMYPWPGIWTRIEPSRLDNPVNDRTSKVAIGKRLKITDVEYKNNRFILKKVQLEGKKEVDFETFNNAYNIFE